MPGFDAEIADNEYLTSVPFVVTPITSSCAVLLNTSPCFVAITIEFVALAIVIVRLPLASGWVESPAQYQ